MQSPKLGDFAHYIIKVVLTSRIHCVEYPMLGKVVIHYIDGKVERGYTTDFRPDKGIFHLVIKEDKEEKSVEKSVRVSVASLKALFFVKEFEGPEKDKHGVKKTFEDVRDQKLIGKKVKVEFIDGEILYGLTMGYSPARRGFFFTPIDPESNNERIFAVMTAVKNITFHE